MNYLGLLQEKGLGPPILALYAFFATFYVEPGIAIYSEQPIVVASGIATAAVLLLFLIGYVFNDLLMKIFAEEELAEAYIQIKVTEGSEKEFYTDYSDETRNVIDEMDGHLHKAMLAILAGGFIAISVIGYSIATYGTSRLLTTVLIALVPIGLLSYPSNTRLHEAIDFAARDATSTHEN